MIKRPLVWIGLAYIVGILCYSTSNMVLLTIVIVWLAACYAYLFCSHGMLEKGDLLLLVLPLFFILGIFRAEKQIEATPLEKQLVQSQEAVIYGTVDGISHRSLQQESYVIWLKDCKVQCKNTEKIYDCKKLYVPFYESISFEYGNRLCIEGTISNFSKATNPGQFDEYLYYKTEGFEHRVKVSHYLVISDKQNHYKQTLHKIRNKIRGVYARELTKKEAGILSAMILGESSLLDIEIKDLYQKNGIAHILAISGLHISLIGLSFFRILKKLHIPLLPTTILCIGMIYSYGVMTMFRVSTNRAVVMLVLMLMAKPLGRTYDLYSAVALGALIILLQRPMRVFQAGFLLSFGAVLGIAILGQEWEHLWKKRPKFLEGLCSSIAASLMTLPVLLWFYYEFPVYSIILNLLVLPFMGLVVLLGIVGGIAGSFSPLIGQFILGSVRVILWFYEWVCEIFAKMPMHRIISGRPQWWQIVLYYSLFLLFVALLRRFQKRWCAGILMLCLLVVFTKLPDQKLKITMLDVGQGESIVLLLPNRRACMIDGGSSDVSQVGKYRLEPFLMYHGISKLDYVIVTHADTDHVNGLKEMMTGDTIAIQTLVLPKVLEPQEKYQELEKLAMQQTISLSYIEQGDYLDFGSVQIQCLYPQKGQRDKGGNSYSTVLQLNYQNFSMLFTGDLDAGGEKRIQKQLSEAIVLKIPHHGSKYSSTASFLQAIGSHEAFISCGAGNSYGHPHEETLQRLKENGTRIWITKESGAICLKTDGEEMKIISWK